MTYGLIFYAMRTRTSTERKKELIFLFFCLFPRKDRRGEKVPIFFFSEHNAFYGHESGACVCECE